MKYFQERLKDKDVLQKTKASPGNNNLSRYVVDRKSFLRSKKNADNYKSNKIIMLN